MRLVKRSRIRHVVSAARRLALGLLAALFLTGISPVAALALPAAGAEAASSCCTVTANGPSLSMKITTPGKTASATFHGTAGQRISAAVTKVVTSDQGCETLTLLDPTGATVTSGSGCGNGNPVGLGPVDLTTSGTYTVRLQLDATAKGSATLWVSAPQTLGTAAVNGPSQPLNVSRVGQGVQRTFTGTSGQRITAAVTKVVTSDQGCETLTLLDPTGATVTSGSGCGNGNPVGLGPVDLTTSGTYTVRLENDVTATGTSTLWVSAPQTVGPVTVNGPSQPLNVSRVGQGVQRTFTGTSGQRITAAVTKVVTSDQGCETLTLLDPTGATVTSGSGCGNGNPVGLGPVDLTTSGTYTVRLENDVTATGTSTLWVSAPKTVGTVTVNGPAEPMMATRVGQGVQRTFAGTAGQRISAVVSNIITSDQGCETVTLLSPSGAAVTSNSGCGNGNPIALGPVKLAKTGTYTVRFEAGNTATGHGSLKVSA